MKRKNEGKLNNFKLLILIFSSPKILGLLLKFYKAILLILFRKIIIILAKKDTLIPF